jgi:hypothetical protein
VLPGAGGMRQVRALHCPLPAAPGAQEGAASPTVVSHGVRTRTLTCC